jgi:hypothetical protein
MSSDPGEIVTLICPMGAADAPISHGTVSYAPYREDHTDARSRWLVAVPRHVAAPLLKIGGFCELERK